jgi:hypothetical protein
MNSKGLAISFFMVSIGLGAWAGWEHVQRLVLEEKFTALSQERDVLRVTAGKKVALASKTEVKSDGPEGLGPEHAKELEEEQKKSGKPEAAAKDDKNPMGEMMKNPAMKEMMKAQMRSSMEMVYRDLFDMLGLDPDKQDKLSKLLAERSSAGMELGMSMMGGKKPGKEEMKAMTDAVQAAKETTDKQIKELLGDDAFGKFEIYEKSQPERMQLKALTGQMKDKGVALSEQVESQLMDAMYQERTNFKFDVDFANQKDFDPEKFTQPNLDRFLEQQATLQEKILARAGTILTPEQLSVFTESQKQQAAMTKMQMEMGMKMMGSK